MTGEMANEKTTCGYLMHDDKPCAKPLYDNEYCIFHSKDIEGQNSKFNDIFWEEVVKQKAFEERYDFTRFVFPGEISFVKNKFDKDVFFYKAKFYGKALLPMYLAPGILDIHQKGYQEGWKKT
jgi:hypothetical protein